LPDASLIRRLLHAIVANPTVYSVCQHTIGAGKITQEIAHLVPSGHCYFLDVGAGSGYVRRMLSEEAHYIPIDIDHAMLRAGGHRLAIQSDASQLPVLADTMDMVLCKQVSHHLTDDGLDHLMDEIHRVLRLQGRLLFMDAVRTNKAMSDLLWRYDRGAHPRAEPELVARIQRRFTVLHREVHWNFHQYILLLLAPIADQQDAVSAGPTGLTVEPR
jgi:ubiquinone/menaquinone biosynthesis C-methylase UbiE